MTNYKALANLIDAFFLTMDMYDNCNEVPVEFMDIVDTYLFNGAVDLEEKSGRAVRAFMLIEPTLNEAMTQSGLFDKKGDEKEGKKTE